MKSLVSVRMLMWLLFAAELTLSFGCYKVTFETIDGKEPLSRIKLSRLNGKLVEVVVFARTNAQLDTIVDTSMFSGVPSGASVEYARQSLGEPDAVRPLSEAGSNLPVHVYKVPKGEIGFVTVPLPGEKQNQVWGFPIEKAADKIILDPSVLSQLLPHLPSDQQVRVRIIRSVGWSGPTLGMTSNRVDYLLLGLRDGEK